MSVDIEHMPWEADFFDFWGDREVDNEKGTDVDLDRSELYRLAAVPSPCTVFEDVILEDGDGGFHVLERHSARLIAMDAAEAMLALGICDLSMDVAWRSYVEWTRLLCPASRPHGVECDELILTGPVGIVREATVREFGATTLRPEDRREQGSNGMYRLGILPEPFTLEDDAILQDNRGNCYILQRHTAHLTLLEEEYARLVTAHIPLNHDTDWRTYAEWTQIVCPAARTLGAGRTELVPVVN